MEASDALWKESQMLSWEIAPRGPGCFNVMPFEKTARNVKADFASLLKHGCFCMLMFGGLKKAA